MARSARFFTFEGQFESGVLGTFRLIRGFANLQNLAEISVPYEMEDGGHSAEVKGQQRKLNPQHAERIKQYLESGEQRAVFDLAWPQGIQEELSQPVAVLLNEGSEVIALASGAGYRCFTSVDAFKSYVNHEILVEDLVA